MTENPTNSHKPITQCIIHNKDYTLFCDNCLCLMCDECRPQHLNHMQSSIARAFEEKRNKLQSAKDALLHKQSEMREQIIRIDIRLQEIKSAKEEIEAESKMEMGQKLYDLKEGVNSQEAVISYEITSINELLAKIKLFIESTESKADKIKFLAHSSSYLKDAEYLDTADISERTDDSATQSLRESVTKIREERISDDEFATANEVKNNVIWKLLKETITDEQMEMKQKEIERMKLEITKYKEDSTKSKQKLEDMKLCCIFCKVGMDSVSVNGKCIDGHHYFAPCKSYPAFDKGTLYKYCTPTKKGVNRESQTEPKLRSVVEMVDQVNTAFSPAKYRYCGGSPSAFLAKPIAIYSPQQTS